MRCYSKWLLATAAATPLAFSQSLSDLPACAQQAGLAAIQTSGCAITEVACLCSKVSVLDSLRAMILQACSVQDQSSALAFANTLCGAAGQPSISPLTSFSTTSSVAEMDVMPASMVSSTSDNAAVYTTSSGAGSSTTSVMNMTMHPLSSSASMNMSMSTTTMDVSMSMTSSPSQFTSGALSRAPTSERIRVLPALGIAAIVMATF